MPKLRFKREDGTDFPEWTKQKLSAVSSRVTRKNKGNITDIPLTIASLYGLVDQREYFKKKIASRNMEGYYLLHNGEFAYNKSYSKGFDFGAIKRLDKYNCGALSTLYICFAVNSKVDSNFMTHYFDSQKWNKEVSIRCAEGARNHGLLNISTDNFFDIDMFLPTDLEEQQKIADFLSNVDEVIAQSEAEVANLQHQKKAAMQKIFSQEVRFKREDGTSYPEWEEKKVRDCCDVFIDGDWIESKDQSEEGVWLIQTGNVGNGVFISKEDRMKFVSNETFERLKCHEVFSGDILISRLPDPAGRACIVPEAKRRMITAVDCTIVRTNSKVLFSIFLAQFYQAHSHFKYVKGLLAGGTRKRIGRTNLEAEIIPIPCLEEQQKIADFLATYDEAISCAKQELDKWKELKKGLLQQMFA